MILGINVSIKRKPWWMVRPFFLFFFFYFLFFYFLFFIDHSTFVHPFELCLPCVVSVSSPPFSPPFKQVNHLQRVLMES